MSIELDTSPSTDMEAKLATLETLKNEHNIWLYEERAKLQAFADRGEGRRELREQGGSSRPALPDAAYEHCDEHVDWCTCSRS